MSQHYSNPARAHDAYALPDVETFYIPEFPVPDSMKCPACEDIKFHEKESSCLAPSIRGNRLTLPLAREHDKEHVGWYWRQASGFLPGPFATQAEALADAQDQADGIDGAAGGTDCIDCDGPCTGHDSPEPVHVYSLDCSCGGWCSGGAR